MNKVAQGRVTLTPADFVRVATSFVDEHGLDALTMRSLGDRLGVDPTALYRHFPNKDALLTAMVDHMLGRIVAKAARDGVSPRQHIRELLLDARREFLTHPNLVPALVASSGRMPNGLALSRLGAEGLAALGLSGRDLVHCAQMLEALVIGASVFDVTGSPDHVEIRRLRYRAIERPDYDEVSRDVADVVDVAETAFAMALDGLLDLCERIAAASAARR
jgi:AcrR family transcriptional regulator